MAEATLATLSVVRSRIIGLVLGLLTLIRLRIRHLTCSDSTAGMRS